MKNVFILFFCLAIAFPLYAETGHTMDVVFKDYMASVPAGYRAVIVLCSNQVWIKTSQFTGENTDLLYADGSGLIRHINHSRREYIDLDEQTVSRTGQAVDSTLEFLRAQWGKVSKNSSPEPAGPYRLSRTATTSTLYGVPCTLYQVFQGNARIQDVWVANWPAVSLSAAQYEPLRHLAAMYGRIAKPLSLIPAMEGFVNIPMNGIIRVTGFPVVIRQYQGERIAYEINLLAPKAKSVSPGLFILPPDYKRTWF